MQAFRHIAPVNLRARQLTTLLVLCAGVSLGLFVRLPRGPLSVAYAQGAAPSLVLSQFQVAGASAADEFVELHNVSAAPVDLNGHVLVYRAAASANDIVLVNWTNSVIVPPGGFYLVTNVVSGGYRGPLPGDATWMSNSTGQFAAAGGGLALRKGAANTGTLIDSVGYGTATNAFVETLPTTAPAANASKVRQGQSCQDTNHNQNDFVDQSPGAPRNAATSAINCAGGTPTLLLSNASASEGNSGTTVISFTVNLSTAAGAGGVSFDVTTSDGTATAGDLDYVPRTAVRQTIAAGNTSTTVTVTINGDTKPEANETFSLIITNVSGATLGATAGGIAQAQGTILNDDFTPVKIHEIQGSGALSPLTGQPVQTTGIVTGVRNNGFFMQAAAADTDDNAATAEAVFVFTSVAPPAAATLGAAVRVTGLVVEFVPPSDPGQAPVTEIVAPTVTQLSLGNPLPAPVTITASLTDPAGPLDQLERLEAMRVMVDSFTVVAPTGGNVSEANATATSNGVFFGVVTGVPRPIREAGIQAPDPAPAGTIPPIPRWDFNPELIRVDSDGFTGMPPLDVAAGTLLTNVTGVLDFAFRRYTILLSAAPTQANTIAPRAVTPATAQEFTVAAYNLQRFFDDVNDPALGEAVLTSAAYQNRLRKASLAIRNYLQMPDVLGVIEIENLTTLQALATQINQDASAANQTNPQYQAYLSEGNDVGGIDVGFLVKTAAVNHSGNLAGGMTPRISNVQVVQSGKETTFANPDGSTDVLNDRPPLILTATVTTPAGTRFPFTVIANHLRSLNGVGDTTPGSSGWLTSGARVRAKRQKQAEFLAQLVQARQASNPQEHLILLGDFNAFAFNDGFGDSMNTIAGTPAPDAQTVVTGDGTDLVNPDLLFLADAPAQHYSYVFDGSAQSLDHMLVNAAMASATFARRLEHPRLNADFPETARNDATSPLRLSDHDALVGYFLIELAKPTRSNQRTGPQPPRRP